MAKEKPGRLLEAVLIGDVGKRLWKYGCWDSLGGF